MQRLLAALLLCTFSTSAMAAIEAFTVNDIRVEGAQRISAGTVFNYLPIKVGDTLTEKGAQQAIRALFQTGFFHDIRLERDGNVLIVTVSERPAIASIEISGTREISESELKQGLREEGFVEGRVFNRSLLEKIEQELRRTYFSRGRYSVKVTASVTPLERNRVAVQIDVAEGRNARIKEINLVGNQQFSEKELLKLLELREKPGLFRSKDKYSRQQLVGDLERLRNFYQDRGFLEFDIESTQVSIAPNKEEIYITINIVEGKKYTISDVRFAGTFVIPKEELDALLLVKVGGIFSRRQITETTKSISDALGDQGYAFANVNAVPEVDEKSATVAFTFFIDPGKRVYVRRIRFEGNLSTQDGVLRREMRQFESAWYSASKIRRSRVRLQRLGFFNSVTVETPTVPGTPDQVDIIVRVEERLTGNLIFGLGFSDAEGVLINASVSESNLFGTGKEISVDLNKSDSVKAVSIRYVNPYFGKGGVSRGFRLFVRDVDTTDLDIGDYETNSRGGGIFFGIPISETRKLNLGLDLEETEIGITVNSAQVAQDFVAANGPENDILKMTFGWSQDSLDRFLFPSKGALQRFTGEISVPGSDLEYYKLTYQAARYWPVSRRTSFRAKGELGWGDGYGDTEELPFYKNFFAGGTSTVRGFESRSLGPRDTRAPFDPIGGDKRVLGNVQYIFPLSGEAQESMRVSLFVDAGQAYGPDDDVDLDLLRYSTGLAFNWLSPVGPLALSYAVPLNDEPFDELERFQFSLGVPFR